MFITDVFYDNPHITGHGSRVSRLLNLFLYTIAFVSHFFYNPSERIKLYSVPLRAGWRGGFFLYAY
jgi:hypothetical protein